MLHCGLVTVRTVHQRTSWFWRLVTVQGTAWTTCRRTSTMVTYTPCESISLGGVEEIKDNDFLPYSNTLQELYITQMRSLRALQRNVFRHLPQIQTITISQVPNMRQLPNHLFSPVNRLKVLRVIHTGLENIPAFKALGNNFIMHIVDFESNKIKRLQTNSVRVRSEQFLLAYNKIEHVEGWAFNGSEIGKISFRGNRELTDLSPDAFNGLSSLRDLDLSETSITYLPTIGLETLEMLRLTDTYTLKTIPSIYDLKSLQKAELTYSFHCCAFKYPARHDPARHARHQKYIATMQERCKDRVREKRSVSDGHGEDNFGAIIMEGQDNFIPPLTGENIFHHLTPPLSVQEGVAFNTQHDDDQNVLSGGWADIEAPGPTQSHSDSDEVFHQSTAQLPQAKQQALCGNLSLPQPPVVCAPVPDALNPCEDIMGSDWLRTSVWLVISTAVFGNIAVLVVLVSARSETSVPRFLMCHLAFADLCMALYLLLLAVTDLRSTGVYFNYAFDWQRGSGCQVAGFMTVFASQLSIFTLSLLTVERWFAIRHALYTNRVDLSLATKIMFVGWAYALVLAALPLIGVSSYSSTSICLPMDTHNTVSVVYILYLLAFTGIAFILICCCYAQIYLSLSYETRHPPGERTVARKMTLLVGTNFACWAPIAFFSLTAVAGYPLIDVTRSKILLVFFYPINSCANPYLYAIMTAQYRKDLIQLLARYGLCTRCAQQYKMVYSQPGKNSTQSHLPAPLLHTDSVQTAEVAV
ncbi:follicle-stimulating hormone receptor-like isoform X2 [Macrosteles quadrilineatus]|uniref:follicle-stimulating hormone receptor-like isoform X2 n=1 Tax=Macrosteles quadrilineatus TaxID=74068 RepID=UPI0023E0B18C|nr:follicle-stimulating hormone receptor-like isoform X2 [Macrosteles quadrilineatus]